MHDSSNSHYGVAMRAVVSVVRLPKAGNRPEEDEDAAYPAVGGASDGWPLRCAVADGASEALLSRPWADLLVYLYGVWPAGGVERPVFLARAYARWRRWRRDYLRRRARQGRPIQWYEEPGLAAGAFAALLGLTLDEPTSATGGRWTALAVGDSCLCQVRDETLLLSFPLAAAADFGVRPLLIGSEPSRNQRLAEGWRVARGDWQPGDRFYLMTDALAAWCLGEQAAGHSPWPALDEVAAAGPAAFDEWVAERRAHRAMRNDDVTLLRIAMASETTAVCPGPN